MFDKTQSQSRLLESDGRSVVVAMDHPGADGPAPGIEDPEALVRAIVDGGADGILANYGILRLVRPLTDGRIKTVLRVDAGTTRFGEEWGVDTSQWFQYYTPEDALRLGCTAIVSMGFIGIPAEGKSLAIMAKLAANCDRLDIPLIGEPVPCRGPKVDDPLATDVVATGARVAAEYGAHFVKTAYTGTAESFEDVTRSCPVPVLTMGGPPMESTRAVLKAIRGALDGGAAGVVFGRNVWAHPDPAAMTRAIVRLVHDDVSIAIASKEL